MAAESIERDEAAVTIVQPLERNQAITQALRKHTRNDLAAFAAIAIDLIDAIDEDPELEHSGDELGDHAWIEWDQLRANQKRGAMLADVHEDSEEDDASGQYDEDYYTGPAPEGDGPGCSISDNDTCEVRHRI